MPDLARETGRRAGIALDDERAGPGRRRRRPDDRLRPSVREAGARRAAGRQLPRRPVGGVERAGAQGADRGLERRRGRRRGAASSSTGRPPLASISEVIASARSAGKSSAAPVGVHADPDDRPGVVRPEADSVSPRTPASLRTAAASTSPSTTRSFGHFRRIVPSAQPGRPPRPRRPSRGSTIAGSRQTRSGSSQVGRKPSESSSAVRRPAPIHVRPSRPRPAVCSRGDARQTSGVAGGQPAADDVVRRADAVELLAAGQERRGDRHRLATAPDGRVDAPRSPAARARTPRGARARRSRGRPRR